MRSSAGFSYNFYRSSFWRRIGSERIKLYIKKTPRQWRGVLESRLGDLADLDGVRSFRTVRDLKSHFVAFTKLVELYVHKLVRVEKEILFLPVDFDEPETPVGESGDCSFLHVDVREIVKSTGCAEGGESTPTYLGQRRLICEGYHIPLLLSTFPEIYFTFDMQRRHEVCSFLVLMYLPPHSHSSTTTSSTLSIHLPSLKKFFDILFNR